MRMYEVRISRSALQDMDSLREFLDAILSEEKAIRYSFGESVYSFNYAISCRVVFMLGIQITY